MSTTMSSDIDTEVMYLRNTRPGEVVFEGGQGDGHYSYRWAGAGDPSGNDIQGVARKLRHDPNMRRTITNGILVEASEAEAEEAFQRQASAYRNRVEVTGAGVVASHLHQEPEVARYDVDDKGRVKGMAEPYPGPAGMAEPGRVAPQPINVDTDVQPGGGVVHVAEDGSIENASAPIKINVTEGPPLGTTNES
jgi:hypothetical protein